MKSVCIIGCGWLGTVVGNALSKLRYNVIGTTTSSSRFDELKDHGITPVLYELNSPLPIELNEIEVFIITIPPKEVHLKSYLKLSTLIKSNAWVIFISSTSVYPNNNLEVFESDALDSSLLVELENIFVKSAIDTTVIRFAGLFGPKRHPGKFLSGKTNLKGANNPINMIHLDDCVDIILKVIESDCRNETFNACADIHPQKSLFYKMAAEMLNLVPPEFNNESQPFKIINSGKLKQKLNYSFIHPDPMEALKSI